MANVSNQELRRDDTPTFLFLDFTAYMTESKGILSRKRHALAMDRVTSFPLGLEKAMVNGSLDSTSDWREVVAKATGGVGQRRGHHRLTER
jgi:hypothetical protein